MAKIESNTVLLQAALEGLGLQRARIDEEIKNVQAMLSGKAPKAAPEPAPAKSSSSSKRELSPAARARIAAAQKKRWAEYRRNKAEQKG
jgi:hypothetical protein